MPGLNNQDLLRATEGFWLQLFVNERNFSLNVRWFQERNQDNFPAGIKENKRKNKPDKLNRH